MKTTKSLACGLMVAAVALAGSTTRAAVPGGDVERMTAAAPAKPKAAPAKKRAVLVFSLCRGFRHDSIPHGAKALEVVGRKTGAFDAVMSDDPAVFERESLRKYDAVVFNNTTGELFLPAGFESLSKPEQEKVLQRDAELKESLLDFVRSGKGVVGIHAATDTFYQWADFGEMMGGYFNGHPWNEKVGVKLDDPGHVLLKAFGGRGFEVADEIYTFKAPYSRDALKVLLSLDREKTPHKGNRADDDYALSWIREYGKGRVFYFAFGHRNEIFWNAPLMEFLLDGIQYALGDLKVDAAPGGTRRADLWMGEYEGACRFGDGTTRKASGKVFPVGGGRYAVSIAAGEETTVLDGRMDGQALALSRRTFDGYVADWEVSGPYSQEGQGGQALFGVVFPPEKPGDREAVWRRVKSAGAERPWIVDLGKVAGGNDVVAYLRAEVESPKDQRAELLLGSDDGVKAWLNGELVHANDVMRGLEPEQDRVEVRLKEGRNVLLLKVNQGGGDWGACAKLVPWGGGELAGVTTPESGGGRWTGTATSEKLVAKLEGGRGDSCELKRLERDSPALGKKPPRGAVVLLPLAEGPPSLKEWENPNWTALADGSMRCGKGDNRTRRKFGDVQLHLEFMIPYEPDGQGQGRGNSGVYLQDRYEIQVLDSFGLPPMDNGCGGIYKVAIPRVNASLPPLKWQTYDVAFRAPRMDARGNITKHARVTVEHNGVLIHDDVEIPAPTGGAVSEQPAAAAPLRLQDHGHAVWYRNIWLVEK